MKLKLAFDNVDFSEVVDGLRDRFQAGVGAMMSEVDGYAKRQARRKLKSGLSKWLNGFKISKVSNDFYIVSIDGKLANWMEDGIQPGEVSRAIMSGNRADVNRGEGKDYVDVPISKDADSMGNISLGKSGPTIKVSAFKDADAMMKSITTSDWKNGGTKKKQVIASRVRDIIKNVEPSSKKVSYLTIRRVTDDSMWPKSPFQGAKVLDDLGLYLEDNFDKILERYM